MNTPKAIYQGTCAHTYIHTYTRAHATPHHTTFHTTFHPHTCTCVCVCRLAVRGVIRDRCVLMWMCVVGGFSPHRPKLAICMCTHTHTHTHSIYECIHTYGCAFLCLLVNCNVCTVIVLRVGMVEHCQNHKTCNRISRENVKRATERHICA